MIVRFLDMEDESNPLKGTSLDNTGSLLQLLDSFRHRTPFFCQLVGENGDVLDIGIGDPACVQHTSEGGYPPYLMALSKSAHEQSDSEFLAGGTLTPVCSRYCLPFDLVTQIAVEFQEKGVRSPSVGWEEI
jgi:hypothetical protein